MNCIKKLPWSAGTYKADKKYYPQDRVFCDGSVFASLREQTGNKPEVIVEADGSYTVTEGWMLLAPGNTESGSGVSDYNLLENRPSVNGHTLEGDKTTEDLGLMPEGGAYPKEEADGIFQTKEKAAEDLQTVTEALDGKVEKEKGKGLSTNDYTDEDKAKVRKALQTESDPTVPDWAKAATKPAYTAKEVGALPDTTKIPTKVSELENDKGFLTEHQSLEAYYQKAAAQLDNRVVAEAMVSLAARLDALEGSRGLLGDATARTLDVRELTRCRYPLVMLGHGVPAESNVPDNLPDGLPWDGVPTFVGQLYVNLDAASGGLYYAVGNENVSNWKQA